MNLTRISLIAFIAAISVTTTANAAEYPIYVDEEGYAHSYRTHDGPTGQECLADKCVTIEHGAAIETMFRANPRSTKHDVYNTNGQVSTLIYGINDELTNIGGYQGEPWNLDTDYIGAPKTRDRCATVIDEDKDHWGVRQTAGTTCFAASNILRLALKTDRAPKGYTCTIKLKIASCKQKGKLKPVGTALIDTDATVTARTIHAGNRVYPCGVARLPAKTQRMMVASDPSACNTTDEMVFNVIRSDWKRHGLTSLFAPAGCSAQGVTVDVCRKGNECMWLVPLSTNSVFTIEWDQALGINYSRIDLDC